MKTVGGRKNRRKLERLCEAQNWRCCYCGCALEIGDNATVEHVLAKGSGGNSSYWNTVAACVSCNTRMDTMAPADKAGGDLPPEILSSLTLAYIQRIATEELEAAHVRKIKSARAA